MEKQIQKEQQTHRSFIFAPWRMTRSGEKKKTFRFSTSQSTLIIRSWSPVGMDSFRDTFSTYKYKLNRLLKQKTSHTRHRHIWMTALMWQKIIYYSLANWTKALISLQEMLWRANTKRIIPRHQMPSTNIKFDWWSTLLQLIFMLCLWYSWL